MSEHEQARKLVGQARGKEPWRAPPWKLADALEAALEREKRLRGTLSVYAARLGLDGAPARAALSSPAEPDTEAE